MGIFLAAIKKNYIWLQFKYTFYKVKKHWIFVSSEIKGMKVDIN